MTEGEISSYLAAMQKFMAKTREPGFRSYLKGIGWTSDADVVIVFDGETIASLLSRLAFNGASNPCLVAIPDDDERIGYRLMFMEALPQRRGRRRATGEPVNPQATVGMLYSSLEGCDAYVPGEWTQGVTFSKAPEPA